MPLVCEFFHYTPDQFYDLTLDDTARLVTHMRKVKQAKR